MMVRFAVLFVAMLFAAGLCPAAPPTATLTTLAGKTITGKVARITGNGQLVLKAPAKKVDLQNLSHISHAIKKSKPGEKKTRVRLLGGGTLLASAVMIHDDTVIVKWRDTKKWQLPIRYVRGVELAHADSDNGASKRYKQLLNSEKQSDYVLAVGDKKVQTVQCVVLALNDRHLTVSYEGEERRIPREKLRALVLAATTDPPDRTGHCLISLNDGSKVAGKVLGADDKSLRFKPFPGHKITLPWKDIRKIKVQSERMVFVSDLDPVEVEQGTIVTYTWSYQKNRNVTGGPLKLNSQSYSEGLGMHAPCRLTYSINGEYTTFVATIGIDDSTADTGDCIFKVIADDDVLFSERVRGKDNPRSIKTDISGHDKVTLAVEAGRHLDLGDNADWCNARFIK